LWKAVRRFATNTGYTKIPTKSKRSVASARTIDEAQLRLKAIATWWEGDRNCEIPRPRVEIGRELLSNAVLRAATFGQRDRLAGNVRFIAHACASVRSYLDLVSWCVTVGQPSTRRAMRVQLIMLGQKPGNFRKDAEL